MPDVNKHWMPRSSDHNKYTSVEGEIGLGCGRSGNGVKGINEH